MTYMAAHCWWHVITNHHILCCGQSSQSHICTLWCAICSPNRQRATVRVCIVRKDRRRHLDTRSLMGRPRTQWLFNKCHQSDQPEYQALLNSHNTPTEGVGTSPAQRFLGRRCKTLEPTTTAGLEPQYQTKPVP